MAEPGYQSARSLADRNRQEPAGTDREDSVELSARNQLKGTVKGVKSGAVMAEITISIEAAMVTAAITDASRERMNLQDGDEVTVVIKSTEVMIAK